MSLRTLSLSTLLAGAMLAGPATAERLLVAGPAGVVYQADTQDGVFEYFACACGGPIAAMAADKDRLYTADTLGQLLVFDVRTGALENIHTPPIAPITALATGEGFLFAGTQSAEIVRIDPATGGTLDSRALPAAVKALLGHRGYLYVATADSAVYRAPMSGGAFTYFSCFCFSNIQALAAQAERLFVVDAFGTAAHIDLATGDIISGAWVGPTNAVSLQGGDFLVHSGAGVIERRDVDTGEVQPGGFTSPIDIEAMLVLRDDGTPPVLQSRLPRSGK
jgi:hypothetical protein